MIDRYSRNEIKKIWDLSSKFNYYLKVELAVCEAYYKLGQIPKENFDEIVSKASFTIDRIDEIEKEVRHDVIAFLTCVNETLSKGSAKYMHLGMTSSDVIDTAFALQIQDSYKLIVNELDILIERVKSLVIKHKNTLCVGRSHGVHAEVMTFGFKLLNWYDELARARKNLENIAEEILVGQISGPVGTYSNIPVEIETLTCEILGLKPANISTQIISRDRYARFISELAILASLIEKYATEIRHLQKTEVRELEEGFSSSQKGSSAMPHKKNPILSENLCGLSRVIRGNLTVALENINLWHERDISHSSAERIIFPDSLILTDFMLHRFNELLKNLVVNKENMLKNIDLYGGIIYSQKILLKLIDKGYTREDAYRIVQKYAHNALNGEDFRQNIQSDIEIMKNLTIKELEDCFNPQDYLKNIEKIYKRFGL